MIKLFHCGGFTRFEGSVYAIKTIMIFIPTPGTPYIYRFVAASVPFNTHANALNRW